VRAGDPAALPERIAQRDFHGALTGCVGDVVIARFGSGAQGSAPPRRRIAETIWRTQ
jgi:hypothetical protein